LKLDALEHTHPIEVAVHHPDEIRSIFDAISYAKGSSVIHMLHDYLGKDAFREGLSYYLQKHAYDNTDTVDLWDALEEASEKPVRSFMQAWTSQAGYPIVHADITNDEVELKQQRFYLNPGSKAATADKTLWPIALQTKHPELPDTLAQKDLKFALTGMQNEKLNSGQSGFYRVVYNATHTQKLAHDVEKGHLSPLDRIGLLADTFEAAKAGHGHTADALQLVEAFRGEDNAAVWDIIAMNLSAIRGIMDDTDIRENMKPYIRELVQKQLDRLGWDEKDNEPYFDKLLRPTILSLASLAEESSVVKEALHRFKLMHEAEDIPPYLRTGSNESHELRNTTLAPDLRGVVYHTAVRHGGKAEFEKLLQMHNESTLSEERTTIASALTGFKQPELIKRALKLITTDAIRLQDVPYWVAYSFSNRHAKQITWEWMKESWPWLEKNLSSDLSFYRFPIYSARAFSQHSFLKEYNEFFKDKVSPALDRAIKQGIETIEWQSAWRERDLKEIKAYFKTHPTSNHTKKP
jgi:aminopeptidase N